MTIAITLVATICVLALFYGAAYTMREYVMREARQIIFMNTPGWPNWFDLMDRDCKEYKAIHNDLFWRFDLDAKMVAEFMEDELKWTYDQMGSTQQTR